MPFLSPSFQGERQGPWGRDLHTLMTGKGHSQGMVGPLSDDREVRRPPKKWWHKTRRASSETLISLLPQSVKGPGVPICQLVLPGHSSFRVEPARCSAVHTNIRACVLLYMHLYDPINTLTYRSIHIHTHSTKLIQCPCSEPSPPTSR